MFQNKSSALCKKSLKTKSTSHVNLFGNELANREGKSGIYEGKPVNYIPVFMNIFKDVKID